MGLNWGWGGFGHNYGLGSEVGMRRGMGLGLRWAWRGVGRCLWVGWGCRWG